MPVKNNHTHHQIISHDCVVHACSLSPKWRRTCCTYYLSLSQLIDLFEFTFVLIFLEFNIAQANTSLWLSAAAYCGSSNYMSHVFKGPTEGFVVTGIIEDVRSDTEGFFLLFAFFFFLMIIMEKTLEGFIGYLPSDKSIYVAYRGSSSTRNWITNLDVVKTAYTSYPECNCEVHKGFYDAEQVVISKVISEVKRLKSLPVISTYSIKTTGHSLGAALGQLTAMGNQSLDHQ